MSKKKAVLISLLAAFGTYILITFGITFYFNLTAHEYVEKATKKYVSIHEDQINQYVFQDLFAESEECNKLTDEELIKSCNKKIGQQLSETIIEEDFHGDSYLHDLAFVKETNGTFKKLGWEGKVIDITSAVNQSRLDSKLPYPLQLFFRQCVYFDFAISEKYACEWYYKTQLNTNETGYILRLVPLTEELDIFIAPFLYAFVLPYIFLDITEAEFSVITIFDISTILVPLIIAIITYRYLNRS